MSAGGSVVHLHVLLEMPAGGSVVPSVLPEALAGGSVVMHVLLEMSAGGSVVPSVLPEALAGGSVVMHVLLEMLACGQTFYLHACTTGNASWWLSNSIHIVGHFSVIFEHTHTIHVVPAHSSSA